MAQDAQGNDLLSVKSVVTSKIKLAPYDPGKKLTAAMIASNVADPITELGDIFGEGSGFVGLITSDGAPQDSRDADDATEFHQPGYKLAADPNLTISFTVAEDNPLTRKMTIGDPDAQGVYHVSDIIQDTKWFAYQETVYRGNNTHRRRLGVLQITGNEPAQDTRGEVSGLALTADWLMDDTVDNGRSRYLQSYYTAAPVAVDSVTVTPATLSVAVGKTSTVNVSVLPQDATDTTITAVSGDETKATVRVDGSTVTVAGVAATDAGKPVAVTVSAGGKQATVQVTVTAAAGK